MDMFVFQITNSNDPYFEMNKQQILFGWRDIFEMDWIKLSIWTTLLFLIFILKNEN